MRSVQSDPNGKRLNPSGLIVNRYKNAQKQLDKEAKKRLKGHSRGKKRKVTFAGCGGAGPDDDGDDDDDEEDDPLADDGGLQQLQWLDDNNSTSTEGQVLHMMNQSYDIRVRTMRQALDSKVNTVRFGYITATETRRK